MPHLFSERARNHGLSATADRHAHFTWETINTGVYLAGGGIFIVGSFFFFPRLEEFQDTGCLLFFIGSLFYLLVTGHDMAEVWQERHQPRGTFGERRGEGVAAFSYLAGTVLFTAGSVFFSSLLGWAETGAWTFIIGSGFFALGAAVNVLQIMRAKTLMALMLMNLTAVSFLVGSVLFTVASIPYLWNPATAAEAAALYGFLAWQYLVGSALFLAGGVFNYWRAYNVFAAAETRAAPR